MSWRLPGGTNPSRQQPRQAPDDYPPLPVPQLPPLRTLNSPRDRHRDRDRETTAASGSSFATLPSRQWTAASRRAERIRGLDSRTTTASGSVSRTASLDDLDRPMDQQQPWQPPPRRSARLRSVDTRPSNLDDLDRSLDEANSHLRALLDLTSHANLATPLMPTSFSPPLRPHDFSDDNRRSKRRKLDSDRLAPSFKGFRYGKYGQVEPGQLRMEMVSCDGGMFSNESSYAAENILRDDNSVYCTKGNRCNIVLRHQAGTVFTLQELVIKAPASMNYSHPVREGMVFVSMNQDDVLSRTAQYQIQSASGLRERPWQATGQEGDWHFFDHDPRRIVSIRHHNDGTTTTRARRSYIYRTEDDDEDRRMAQMPQEFASNLPDFHVTTECSGDEDDDCNHTRILTRRPPPNRIGALPFETPDSDSSDSPDLPNAFDAAAAEASTSQDPLSRNHQRRHSRGNITLAEAMDAHASATQDALRAVGGELLTPHGRFFIEKRKSRCTIRFDPPVSGRFILLKMWSSQLDASGNIDIQSVIARGFAGPRYFPSVELC